LFIDIPDGSFWMVLSYTIYLPTYLPTYLPSSDFSRHFIVDRGYEHEKDAKEEVEILFRYLSS